MSLSEKLQSAMKADGHDHIRVSVQAATVVGRMSSADYRYEFFIPHLGTFRSPVCFANWLASGVDEARHNPEFRVKGIVRGYRKYILYGKFFQLCRMRHHLVKEKLDLPFVSYRVHPSGIRETSRWKEYAPMVKDMVLHVVDPERGPTVTYTWPAGLQEEIDARVKEIAAAQGFDPEQVAPSAPAKRKKKKKKPVKVADETTVVEQQQEQVATETVVEQPETTLDQAAEAAVTEQ